MKFKEFPTNYSEFLELAEKNPADFSVICRVEDFEVRQQVSTGRCFYYRRDKDSLESSFKEVEIVAELNLSNCSLLRMDDKRLPYLFDSFCCGCDIGNDGQKKYFWFDDPKELNTQMNYMYRDAANYKTHYEIVVGGKINEKQKEIIRSACEENTYFIPRAIGLEGGFTEMDTEYDPELDHPWCEINENSFTLTRKKADSGFTVEELVEAFNNTKACWENFNSI